MLVFTKSLETVVSIISRFIIVYPKLNSEHWTQLHCSQTLLYRMCDIEYITDGIGRVESTAEGLSLSPGLAI